MTESGENVRVVVRVKPSQSTKECVETTDRQILLQFPSKQTMAFE